MKSAHYFLLLERSGVYGPETIILNTEALRASETGVADIQQLDFRFERWKGDSLVTNGQQFLVTASLGADLLAEGITGFRLDPVIVSGKPSFKNSQRSRPELASLPEFQWLRLEGTGEITMASTIKATSGDDLIYAKRIDFVFDPQRIGAPGPVRPSCGLVVTQRAFDLIKRHGFQHYSLEKLTWEQPAEMY
ncbi:hypothetical protein CCAX7_55660 [Capsulimonas corticalis]|uniref:Uncharacterized protein n=1 Tax=Capsulimonas corticalis TaxID=2219043 RepID=A0A402D0X5_9BACT|nr:hypothetical protein [Capsulimonas corticalis]BDI33515.1 hypothetical protein CCAX7_55660 [Capsulimonas corticalis]